MNYMSQNSLNVYNAVQLTLSQTSLHIIIEN